MATPKPPENTRESDTRTRLVVAGLALFGRHDFDNVTTRQLADAAGVNLAAIPYHFGTKENVYRAVAGFIVDSVTAEIDAAVAAARDRLAEPAADHEAVLGELRRFLVVFAHTVLGADNAAARSGFILREQLNPSAAFDILYQGFMQPIHQTLSALVARILDQPADSPATITRAHAVFGQILGFRMAREALCRRLGTRTIDAEAVGGAVADRIVQALRLEANASQQLSPAADTDSARRQSHDG